MSTKAKIKKMVSALVSEDYAAADAITHDILKGKINENMDQRRTEVAANLFGTRKVSK